MSRTSIRAAVQTYIAQSGIANLGKVYATPPKITQEQEFFLNTPDGAAEGAVVHMHLDSQRERRIQFAGSNGIQRARTYTLSLLIFFRSMNQDPATADAANDAFLDALVAYLRADPYLGAKAANVFLTGEGEGPGLGGEDFTIDTALPVPMNSGSVNIFNLMRISIVELV